MKIRWRLTLMLLLMAILPLLIVSAWTLHRAETALTDLGTRLIRQNAESVARQMELYLAAHPDLAGDADRMKADTGLQAIAVQIYGDEGYTAVFDDRGVVYFHPVPELIGQDLHTAVADLPDLLSIVDASLDGTPTGGYYKWREDPTDPRSLVRDKYMYVVPVSGTPLRVASTTYLDEFFRPIRQLRLQLLIALLLAALVAVVIAFVAGQWFSRPIVHMAQMAERVAAGDLTAKPSYSPKNEYGQLAAAFARMTDNLSDLIRQARTMSLELSSAAAQVTMTQRQHADNSIQQAEAVSSAGSAVKELASSSAHIAETAQQVVAAAGQAQTNARQGVAGINEATRRLERIAQGNQTAIGKVGKLGDLAREIDAAMDRIEDIAAQTRLIAFNASIEAAAAGEAGRRFAVVASEVRRLAGTVAQFTEEIRAKVEAIQTTTNELIIASEREGKEIEQGLEAGEAMTRLLDQIYESAEQTTLAAEQISLATQQQRTATEQLFQDLQPLTHGAQMVAAGSQEIVTVMEDLARMAHDLQQAIERFRLPEDENPNRKAAENAEEVNRSPAHRRG